jgi:hypothetical protein
VSALKVILIAIALLLGAIFTYEGLGYEFGIFSYQALAAYGLPIGIALFAFALLIANRWKAT